MSKHQKYLNALKQEHLARKCWSTHQRIFLDEGYELKGLKVKKKKKKKKSSEHLVFKAETHRGVDTNEMLKGYKVGSYP